MGMVTLTQGPQGVLVSADLSGLPPGGHGFHIHAVGACAPDFSAAGSHFGPGEESHGFPSLHRYARRRPTQHLCQCRRYGPG